MCIKQIPPLLTRTLTQPTGTWPEFCDPQYKFDDEAVADLMPDLKEEWPSDLDSNEGQSVERVIIIHSERQSVTTTE